MSSGVRQRNNIKSSLKGGGDGAKPSLFQKVRFAVDDVIFNRSKRDKNITRIEEMSIWPYILTFVIFLVLAIYLVDYLHHVDDNIIATSDEDHHLTFLKVPCSKDYGKKFSGCFPKICGRVIEDGIFDDGDITTLKNIAEKGMKYGGGSGGATILDLHSGALSFKDKFINIYKFDKNVFTSNDFRAYSRIKNKILHSIANTFKIDQNKLYLTKPTFFSRMDNKPAVTKHDEYWHKHIDRITYGTFYYTSLLYLTTYGKDFTGGRFMFADKKGNKTIEPRRGRLSFFTSASENPHFVERVENGTRFALTVSFTCDKKHSIKDPSMK